MGSVFQRWTGLGQYCAYQPKSQGKRPCEEVCHYPQWNEYCTDMGWKATLPGGSYYSKWNTKKPDYTLQMHTGKNSLIFGDMSCGQMKLKIKLFGHNDHRYVWRKRGKPNCETWWWQHHVVGLFCCVEELVHFTKSMTSWRRNSMWRYWTNVWKYLPGS